MNRANANANAAPDVNAGAVIAGDAGVPLALETVGISKRFGACLGFSFSADMRMNLD